MGLIDYAGQNYKIISRTVITMNSRHLEIRKRINLSAYLKELSVLAGRQVNREELMSLEFTAEFQGKVAAIPATPSTKFRLQFNVLRLPVFATFIERLHEINPQGIYLWTSHTIDCGLFKLADVSEVHYDFPFELDPAGIFAITTADGQDRMLLDFSQEEDGLRSLELGLYGQHWVKVSPSFF